MFPPTFTRVKNKYVYYMEEISNIQSHLAEVINGNTTFFLMLKQNMSTQYRYIYVMIRKRTTFFSSRKDEKYGYN